MPGLHFVAGKENPALSRQVMAAMRSLLHDGGYTAELLFNSETAAVGCTAYPGYPVARFEDEDLLAIVEGEVHGLPRAKWQSRLAQLAQGIFGTDRCDTRHPELWLKENPGDYLILLYQKPSRRWGLFNDLLGRLPVYYRIAPDRSVFSRELRFVSQMCDEVAADRLGVAELLMFGYQVGDLTLLDRVRALLPGTLIEGADGCSEVSVRRLHESNLDESCPVDSIDRVAGDLADLFVEGTQQMVRPTTLVSLSGGADSRSVAAAVKKIEHAFTCLTFRDAAGWADKDTPVASQIATALDTEWRLVGLQPPTGAEVKQIILQKGGGNYTSSAATLEFMRFVETTFGRDAIFLTGDGGDSALPLMTPPISFRNAMAAADFAVVRLTFLPDEIVTNLCRLPSSAVHDHLASVVKSYPESTLERQYLHHLLWDRGHRRCFEGEDCNRCHLWVGTPFYYQPFFEYAMRCPDSIKAGRRLYARFLRNLSPAAAAIPPAGSRLVMGSLSYQFITRAKQYRTRLPRLVRAIKSRMRPTAPVHLPGTFVRCIQRQYDANERLRELLDPGPLRFLLDRAPRWPAEGLHNLLTVTSALALHLGGDVCLDEFEHEPMY